jgi:hypothetical protein
LRCGRCSIIGGAIAFEATKLAGVRLFRAERVAALANSEPHMRLVAAFRAALLPNILGGLLLFGSFNPLLFQPRYPLPIGLAHRALGMNSTG